MAPITPRPSRRGAAADQIGIALPPDGPGPIRKPHKTSVEESYRMNTLRVRVTATLNGPQFDVVPVDGRPSAAPSALFGDDVVGAHYLPASNPYGELATRDNNLAAMRLLARELKPWAWQPAVAFPPGREWLEHGAIVLNGNESKLLELSARCGHEVIVRWTAAGLTPVLTSTGAPLDDQRPTPVEIESALTGCPMRGGIDAWCGNQGYHGSFRALRTSATWQAHRQLLRDGLGCTACLDGRVGAARSKSLDEWFEPNRAGGWVDHLSIAASHRQRTDAGAAEEGVDQ